MADTEPRGVLDTCAYIDLGDLEPEALPDIPEITAITMAELQQGVAVATDPVPRAARLEKLSAAVEDFEPLPFDGEAANRYGTLVAMTVATGQSPRPRRLDLMIAAIASVHRLPLYTRNPGDFKGFESVLRVVEV